MDGIAAYMVRRKFNNQILMDQLREVIVQLLERIPVKINLKQQAIVSAPIKPLKDRLTGRLYPAVDVEHDVRSYGILVQDHSKLGAYKYAHKQFFEFIVARIVARRLLGVDKEETAAIVAATNVDLNSITDMPESLSFLGELLSKRARSGSQARELISSLFNTIVLSNKVRLPNTFARALIWQVSAPVSFGRVGGFRVIHFLINLLLCPSTMLVFLMFLAGGYLGWFDELMNQGVNALNSTSLFVLYPYWILGPAVAVYVALMITLSLAILARPVAKRLSFWILVIKAMGFTRDDIASAYGKLVARRIEGVGTRYLRL